MQEKVFKTPKEAVISLIDELKNNAELKQHFYQETNINNATFWNWINKDRFPRGYYLLVASRYAELHLYYQITWYNKSDELVKKLRWILSELDKNSFDLLLKQFFDKDHIPSRFYNLMYGNPGHRLTPNWQETLTRITQAAESLNGISFSITSSSSQTDSSMVHANINDPSTEDLIVLLEERLKAIVDDTINGPRLAEGLRNRLKLENHHTAIFNLTLLLTKVSSKHSAAYYEQGEN